MTDDGIEVCPACKGNGWVELNGDVCAPAKCDVCDGARCVPTAKAKAFDPRSYYGETPEQTAARLASAQP